MHLVMFDIDGTLVDSNGFDGDLFAGAVREVLGIDVDRTWRSYRNLTDSGVLSEVLSQHDIDSEAAYSAVKGRFIELIRAHLSDMGNAVAGIPGARSLISRLQAIPALSLAIATGGWRETAELKLAHVGIQPAHIPLATSSEAEARVDIMRQAERLAGSGLRFERRTYFGDTPWDRKASAELGYSFVGIGEHVEHSVKFADLRDQDGILSILGA
jgi:beta-phosphoglucomutase-like phosphatase (HAD superfamily)